MPTRPQTCRAIGAPVQVRLRHEHPLVLHGHALLSGAPNAQSCAFLYPSAACDLVCCVHFCDAARVQTHIPWIPSSPILHAIARDRTRGGRIASTTREMAAPTATPGSSGLSRSFASCVSPASSSSPSPSREPPAHRCAELLCKVLPYPSELHLGVAPRRATVHDFLDITNSGDVQHKCVCPCRIWARTSYHDPFATAGGGGTKVSLPYLQSALLNVKDANDLACTPHMRQRSGRLCGAPLRVRNVQDRQAAPHRHDVRPSNSPTNSREAQKHDLRIRHGRPDALQGAGASTSSPASSTASRRIRPTRTT